MWMTSWTVESRSSGSLHRFSCANSAYRRVPESVMIRYQSRDPSVVWSQGLG